MRASGILMHITSLPGPYGVGTMGEPAFRFVDFLKKAGQQYWQILPLTPTGYGNSPYQSCSTFAGNPYLIDLSALIEQGLLLRQEVEAVSWGTCETKTDFGALYENRLRILRLAYRRFEGGPAFETFCRDNGNWLPDFALFMALKEAHAGRPWYEWETELKFRQPEAIWQARRKMADSIRFYCFVEYVFFTQWDRLRAYAHENDVEIIGDVPIYVPLDSADVWGSPELFFLDEALNPIAVAGCPPDGFTENGQLWGNPLYRWDRMAQDRYAWWMHRLEAAGKLYDVIRMDHFRGLESYWAVPFGDKTARGGMWVKGPGLDFVQTIKNRLPHLRMIAEDLGYMTQEVMELREASGYPGMRVLAFAFDTREPSSDFLPHNFERHTVCYTGTHDNVTMRQWFDTASEEAVAYAREYMALTEDEGLVRGVIRTAMSSVADLCIIPMQDYLDIGAAGRMNLPGSMSDANWTWRVSPDACSEALAEEIGRVTGLYGRLKRKKLDGEKNPA